MIKHGLRRTPEYRAWCAAKTRCYDTAHAKYPRYGGRGIVMCERWKNDPAAFLQDMGKRPSKRHSLDRKNNDGNYTPENCRWATRKQQAKNKTHGRTNRKLTDQQVEEIKALLIDAEKSCSNLAVLYGVSKFAILDIARGKTWRHLKASPTISAGI